VSDPVGPMSPDYPMSDGQNGMMDGRYQMMDGGDGSAWMAAFAVFALLALLLAVAGIVALLLRSRHASASGGTATSSPPDAGRVLDDRLARGEVNPAEYQEIRALLERTG
jgi:uncharacterized membrane protein